LKDAKTFFSIFRQRRKQMKLSFTKSWTVFLTVMALKVSAIGVTPAHAAGFIITKTADTADGTCDTDCSLREAIIAANAAPGDDTITVPAGTYTLTIAGAGEDAAATGDLDITSNITISGAGADSTIIEGGTSLGTSVDRVFHIAGAFTVNISGVTIRNGIGNSGGGIMQQAGTLTITNSAFSGNSVSGIGNSGAGIFHNVGTLTITNSTFSDNSASGGSGAGIYANSGTATITNSTFSGNSAFVGGGIFEGFSTLTITNSTFSGNSANDYYGYGGGIYRHSAGGAVTLYNTIIANSTSGGNCSGTIINGGNNIDSGATCGWGSANGSMSGDDPLLGALTGSPAYFPLNAGSPAIDAGDDAVCANPPVSGLDQRGVARPQGAHCDIGSYEGFLIRIYLPLVVR
jgi:CSLREA domain-containing protein